MSDEQKEETGMETKLDPKEWFMKHTESYSLSDFLRDEEDERWSEMAPGFLDGCNATLDELSVEELYDDIGEDDKSGSSPEFLRLSDLADKGDYEAQYALGLCFDNGYGTEQSYADAVKWYRKSAKKGHDGAQLNLGYCYYNGLGVRKSYRDAVKWFRYSADQGNAKAQLNMGIHYNMGQGVEKSYAEAAKWYLLAAQNEDCQALAQCKLGILYELGLGVEKSQEEADRWFALARENGCNPEDHYVRRSDA